MGFELAGVSWSEFAVGTVRAQWQPISVVVGRSKWSSIKIPERPINTEVEKDTGSQSVGPRS